MIINFNEESKGQLWEAFHMSEDRYDLLCELIEIKIAEQVKLKTGVLDKRPIMAALLTECDTVEELACMMYMFAQVLHDLFEDGNPMNDFMKNIRFGT